MGCKDQRRCRNAACSYNRRGRCTFLPNSKFFKCKQAGDEIVDIGI